MFVLVSNASPSNITELAHVGRSRILATMVKPTCVGQYVLHMFTDVNNRSIHIINNVTTKMIQEVVPHLYRPERYNNIDIKEYHDAIKNINQYFSRDITSIAGEYIRTIEEIKRDMTKNYNFNRLIDDRQKGGVKVRFDKYDIYNPYIGYIFSEIFSKKI
jgi:hypothetical protein